MMIIHLLQTAFELTLRKFPYVCAKFNRPLIEKLIYYRLTSSVIEKRMIFTFA